MFYVLYALAVTFVYYNVNFA